MGASGSTLLALIFLKVVIILLGALLYATGPLMIGLVATESGAALARAWASAVACCSGLPLRGRHVRRRRALDQRHHRAGVLVGGSGGIAHCSAGCCSRSPGWRACGSASRSPARRAAAADPARRTARARSSRRSSSSSTSTPAAASATNSLRGFGSRVGQAGSAAVGALSASGPVGAGAARVAGGSRHFARGGLVGVAGERSTCRRRRSRDRAPPR